MPQRCPPLWEACYEQVDPHVYSALDVENPELPPVEVTISGAFGDAYLA